MNLNATDPRVVRIGYEIRQVKDIDCVAQRYFCDFTLFLKWHAHEYASRALSPRLWDGGGGGKLSRSSFVGQRRTRLTPGEDVQPPDFYISNEVELNIRDRDCYAEPSDPPGVVTL